MPGRLGGDSPWLYQGDRVRARPMGVIKCFGRTDPEDDRTIDRRP